MTVRIEGLEGLEALATRLTQAVATIREAQALLGGAPVAFTHVQPMPERLATTMTTTAAPVVMTGAGPRRVEFTPAEFAQRTALRAQNFEEQEEAGYHDTKAAP